MTITAKNYAAQAQRASIGISAKNSAHKAAIYMARTLPDAQHFALPDGGKVLNDGLRGLEGTDPPRLPFPVISVEWWSEGSRFEHARARVASSRSPGKSGLVRCCPAWSSFIARASKVTA